jgi:hypothetical protein
VRRDRKCGAKPEIEGDPEQEHTQNHLRKNAPTIIPKMMGSVGSCDKNFLFESSASEKWIENFRKVD